MTRLFVGVPIAPSVAHGLAGAAETLARRARSAGVTPSWVAPASYHVTIAFLGAARPEALDAVRVTLDEIAATASPLRMRIARLGGFATLDRATVLWAGVEDSSGELARVADRVAAGMAELGFARDPRPYHPHVTLARFREPSALGEVVLPLSEQMFGESRCDSLTLFETIVNQGVSTYRAVARASLGTPKSAVERQTERVQTPLLDASHGSDDGWDRTT